LGSLKFLSYRELRTSTSKIKEALTADGKIVVTNNGKPEALMLQVDETNFEETLSLLNQLKLTRAINNLQQSAQNNGVAEMSLDDINAEIAQTRKEKKERLMKEAPLS